MTIDELISELNSWKNRFGGKAPINIFLCPNEVYSINKVNFNPKEGVVLECDIKETYGEFEFSTDDFFKSVLPLCHEPISERDSYNADF